MERDIRTRLASETVRQRLPVWALIASIAALSLGLWGIVLPTLAIPSTELSAPWWLLALAFALVESFVVNLHFRSESGSFSLLEIPLVFGLLFTEPSLLWVAIIVGSGPSLFFIRRQAPIKVVFNVANLSLHVAVACIIFSAVLGDTSPLEPRGWIALFAATTLTSILELSCITAVIALTERQFSIRRARNTVAFGWLVATANTLQALIAVLIVVVEPWGAILLTGSTAVLFVAYRAYVSERDHRERVEFLYHSTRTLRESAETNSAVPVLLEEATSMFRAGVAELILFGSPDSGEPAMRFQLRDGDHLTEPVTDGRLLQIDKLTLLAEMPFLAFGEAAPSLVRSHLDDLGVNDAMIGTLRSDQRPIGLLIVGDRLGNVVTFTSEDLHLFKNLVEQSAVALENDQLEQALARLRELESELSLQARYDLLTGLANRNLFNTQLDERLATSPDDPLSLLYIDLDDFKLVNDRLGHSAGDLLLTEVARRIEAVIRPSDVAARLGGDEFSVMLTSQHDANAVAHRIIGTLSAPFQIGPDEVRIGASVGIAPYTASQTAATLLHEADLAMYAAKDRGKGSVAWYSSALLKDQSRQQALQTDLRRAISDEEFDVVYQPIVRLRDLEIVGAEALVRWHRSDDEILTPAAFIVEAERSGLIMSIDRLVRRLVFDHVGDFNAIAGPEFFTSLNLSARHLHDPHLVAEFEEDIEICGVDASNLIVEVTESAFVGDASMASRLLQELRALGIRIALDDFGTGYSSLSYLRELPIDFLKIAHPFIKDLVTPNGPSFVNAIASLGHNLSLTVIAEGIEDFRELNILQDLDCDLGQGFHFARPMPYRDLLKTLTESVPEAA